VPAYVACQCTGPLIYTALDAAPYQLFACSDPCNPALVSTGPTDASTNDARPADAAAPSADASPDATRDVAEAGPSPAEAAVEGASEASATDAASAGSHEAGD
jgi:hypothetical protein